MPALAGDVNGDLSNNYENSTVDSNNASTSNTNNYNATGAGSAAPVMSAIAPTVVGGGGSESCLLPTSTGISLSVLGLATGTMEQDDECNRRRDARLLGGSTATGNLGLQISGISVMCANARVFKAMTLSNTPCPIVDVGAGRLLIGRDAYIKMREAPSVYVVGYAEDKAFWDSILLIGKKLPDVQVQDTRPTLSSRFRSRDGGKPDDTRPADSSGESTDADSTID